MAEILHQLSSAVYPIMFKVLYIYQVMQDFFHQREHCFYLLVMHEKKQPVNLLIICAISSIILITIYIYTHICSLYIILYSMRNTNGASQSKIGRPMAVCHGVLETGQLFGQRDRIAILQSRYQQWHEIRVQPNTSGWSPRKPTHPESF